MKTSFFLTPLILSFALAQSLWAGEDPNRFKDVERWVGTIDEETIWEDSAEAACYDLEGHASGKTNETRVIKTTGHWNVNLPVYVQKETAEEKAEREKEKADEDKQIKKLNQLGAMAAAITGQSFAPVDADEDNGGGFYQYWGDQDANHPDSDTPSLGHANFQWTDTLRENCPNRKSSLDGKGSDNSSRIGVGLSMLIQSDQKNYNLLVSPQIVFGGYKQKDWSRAQLEVGSPPHKVVYTNTSTETCTKEGHCQSTSSTTHPHVSEESSSYASDFGPVYSYPVGGGVAISAKSMDMDKFNENFERLVKNGNYENMEKAVASGDPAQAQAALDNSNQEALKQEGLKWTNPIPQTGMVLSGDSEIHSEDKGVTAAGDPMISKWKTTVRWHLVPEGKSDFEAEVEIKNYEKWIPKGSRNPKDSGDAIQINVQVIDKKTGKPAKNVAVKKYSFYLKNTSREPGVAMNWPAPGKADKEFDLKFESDPNPGFEIQDDGQTMVSKEKEALGGKGTAILSSFDWGAYADLVVTVDMGGVPLVGYLKGEKSTKFIPIPKRSGNSLIADAWKEQYGVQNMKDDWDEENQPEGDKHGGDGLTLYEEYRGVYSSFLKKHVYPNPTKKDYFLVNNIGSDAKSGIQLFKDISKLNVIEMETGDLSGESGHENVINFNHANRNHRVDQHGVIMEYDPSTDNAAETHFWQNHPNTPGDVKKITISAFYEPFGTRSMRIGNKKITRQTYKRTVAHELMHSVDVWHHGDRDLGVVYWYVDTAGGKDYIYEKKDNDNLFGQRGKMLMVINDEQGDDITEAIMTVIKRDGPMRVYVGRKDGQHSGMEQCVMRYYAATAYDPNKPYSRRRVFTDRSEVLGYQLCNSPAGTGVNAGSYPGYYGSRFGPADTSIHRGDCQHQICVNDAYMGKNLYRWDDTIQDVDP